MNKYKPSSLPLATIKERINLGRCSSEICDFIKRKGCADCILSGMRVELGMSSFIDRLLKYGYITKSQAMQLLLECN